MIEETIIKIMESKKYKGEQIIMGVASIEFRQPIAINYGKNARKGKGRYFLAFG